MKKLGFKVFQMWILSTINLSPHELALKHLTSPPLQFFLCGGPNQILQKVLESLNCKMNYPSIDTHVHQVLSTQDIKFLRYGGAYQTLNLLMQFKQSLGLLLSVTDEAIQIFVWIEYLYISENLYCQKIDSFYQFPAM